MPEQEIDEMQNAADADAEAPEVPINVEDVRSVGDSDADADADVADASATVADVAPPEAPEVPETDVPSETPALDPSPESPAPSAPAKASGDNKIVVAVKLRYNPRSYWFDPVLSSYATGDHVLVDTERGREIGLVVDGALEVTPAQLKEINPPLKPVIRVLGEPDFERIDELDAKGREAMPVFRELIEKHELDMKPVSVEYLFSGDKAVFYFSNDDRVDFRDLVRDLASRFHIRVDMRQIGVRDEARILGGLAHCGEELCCTRLGGEFQPVSIRMAKEQDLPLNPTKISGACGRLMCCLRYEFEAYKDFKSRAPKKGALIETPIGQAKVIDFDTPREVINLRLEDGKQLSVPLKEFECDKDGEGHGRPCRISRETIDRCASSSILMALAALEQELQVAETAEAESKRGRRPKDGEQGSRRLRRGKRRGGESDAGQDAGDGKDAKKAAGAGAAAGKSAAGGGEQEKRRSRNRRRGEGVLPRKRNAQAGPQDKPEGESRDARKSETRTSRPRPGQHSSGLRGANGNGGPGGAGGHGGSERVRKERSNNQSGGNSGNGSNGANSNNSGNSGESQGQGQGQGAKTEGRGGLRRRRRSINKPQQ